MFKLAAGLYVSAQQEMTEEAAHMGGEDNDMQGFDGDMHQMMEQMGGMEGMA